MTTATAARERPILFSGEMVRAILDGRKSVTRRVVKPQSLFEGKDAIVARYPRQDGCTYGQPGDRLWVRETWQDYCPLWHGAWCGHGTQEGIERDHRPVYRADPESLWLRGPEGKQAPPLRWRPSIHMPRWASRIALEITDVRVERLQEITEEDAKADGVAPFPLDPEGDCWTDGKHRTAFEYLWNEIHGWSPKAFEQNPWVWVISFRRISP